MSLKNIIKTVYFYLFSLIGLVIIVIGGIQLLNIGLKTYVFTAADSDRRLMMKQPTCPYASEETMRKIASGNASGLSESDKDALRRWTDSYKQWEEERNSIDYVSADRSREAATSTAMILVGIPLFAYHWLVIRKELRKKDENE